MDDTDKFSVILLAITLAFFVGAFSAKWGLLFK